MSETTTNAAENTTTKATSEVKRSVQEASAPAIKHLGQQVTEKKAPKPEGEKQEQKKPVEDDHLKAVAIAEKKAREKDKEIKRLVEKERELQEIQQLAKVDKFKALEKAGISAEELIADLIEMGSPDTPEKRIKQLERRTEAKLKEIDEAEKAKQQREEQAQVSYYADKGRKEYDVRLDKVLTDDTADRWEIVKSYGDEGRRMAWTLIESYFTQTGQFPTDESLMDTLEKHLHEDAENAPYARVKASKKLQAKVNGGVVKHDNDAGKKRVGSRLDSFQAKESSGRKSTASTTPPTFNPKKETYKEYHDRLLKWRAPA